MLFLLDTNAYLRLAKHFNPLLGNNFIVAPDSLTVLSEVNSEISASNRLSTQFSWSLDPAFVANRLSNLFPLTSSQPTEILKAKSFINSYSDSLKKTGAYKSSNLTPPSPTDCLVLAYGYVTKATVVSDDGGMHFLSKQLDITFIGGHELLKIMLDSSTIQLNQLQALARYLNYMEDLPGSWVRSSRKIFGVQLP